MKRLAVALLPLLAVLATSSPAGARAPRCAGTFAHRSLRPITSYDPAPGAPRVFAMQFKQMASAVVTYGSYRTRIECMLRRYVLPHLARRRPNVVVFNEDVGLMTAATGSRGAKARADAADGSAITLLADLKSSYARPAAYYEPRFPGLSAKLGEPLLLATDTAARGWMTTFSRLARKYRLYMIGSSDQPPFRASRRPADIAALADPDIPRPKEVYVATSGEIYNEVFMWGPGNVRRHGPPMLRNVVARNRKVPLTDIELALALTPGPATGAAAVRNLRPYHLPGTRARLGFATSLPAFEFGDPAAKPCADVAKTYMRCLDKLGANVVIQDEANPGAWPTDPGFWQPLDWMRSTWRATSDPTVHFRYAVDPMMVGNLGELIFDGQSAITQRGLRGRRCTYVGNGSLQVGDAPDLAPYAGAKQGFLAVAPWVVPDTSRDALRAVAGRLAPASGDPLVDDYLETALIADLPFPADAHRRACRTAAPPPLH